MRTACALVPTALLAAAAPAVAGQQGRTAVPLSVLERPATAADTPPRAIPRDSAAGASDVDAATIRLARTDRGAATSSHARARAPTPCASSTSHPPAPATARTGSTAPPPARTGGRS